MERLTRELFERMTDLRKFHNCSPLLEVFVGMRLMVTTNQTFRVTASQYLSTVGQGVGNGTVALLKSVVLKKDARKKWTTLNGLRMQTIYADEIKYLTLESIAVRELNVQGLDAKEFPLTPIQFAISYKFPSDPSAQYKLSCEQFPLVATCASTCHKIQGTSLDSVCLGSDMPDDFYWIYVALSRVRTLEGLFLMKRLKEDVLLYQLPTALLRFHHRLAQLDAAAQL